MGEKVELNYKIQYDYYFYHILQKEDFSFTIEPMINCLWEIVDKGNENVSIRIPTRTGFDEFQDFPWMQN